MSLHKINEQLNHLSEALLVEKKEEKKRYKQKMSGTSFKERRKEGVCRYPVKIEKTFFDAGERMLVKITNSESEHYETGTFRSGVPVELFFVDSIDGAAKSISGVVNRADKREMFITLNSLNLPNESEYVEAGVQILFDEKSYKEMEKALREFTDSEDKTIIRLKKIIYGFAQCSFNENYAPVENYKLNKNQNKALNLVLSANDLAVIHGPPGTGKTTTLIQAILQTLEREKQVLVCAPSNAAVDLLVEKLVENKVETIRIGHPARITPELLDQTTDVKITKHPSYKYLKDTKKRAEEFRRTASKYKRKYRQTEREQRKELYREASRLSTEAEMLENYIIEDITTKASVVACTMIGAAAGLLKNIKFRTVFIDEAAQALEPANLIPIMKAERIIFAGDHCQLPPTVKSPQAVAGGLSRTLFEKVAEKQKNAAVMLNEQYRMNRSIMTFSSKMFYDNRLIANEKVADHKIFNDDMPLEFIDTAGCGFFEQTEAETKSTYNREEADLLFKHFVAYIKRCEEVGKLNEIQNIGIISPYKAQVNLLNEKFEEMSEAQEISDSSIRKISVRTIDSFQGQERDIVYISLVRSNEKGETGFLSDTRRMNVAMTRAKKKLVIIGDSGTITNNKFYENFLDYVNAENAYRSAFEFIDYS